jgi:iron complex transport system ATP-binding protein
MTAELGCRPVLLSLQDVSLRAGARRLFDGLSVDIRRGELWCVLGANGSGKTSLLHAVAGLRAPDTGRIELVGRLLEAWAPAEAALQRGLLPQTLHDAFGASALEIVLAGRHPHLQRWAWENEADREIALDALRVVDLGGFGARDVLTLSGGERQRVGIAALLAQDPTLLLLDEPLAHLDLKHQVGLLEHLATLVRDRGKAVLLSTHDLNLARRFATHALLLRAESVPMCGPVDEVMTAEALGRAFGHPVTRLTAGSRTLFVPL